MEVQGGGEGVIAFRTGFRGEEVPLVSLEGLLNFWMETREGEHDKRHMMMTLSGQFKGEVDSTWSNIPFCLWMKRIMRRRVHCQHRTKGWLFWTKTGARAKFRKYEPTFRSLVTLARTTNSRLVASAIEPDDFSLW